MRRQWHTPLWVVDILASCATAAAHPRMLPIFHLFPSPRTAAGQTFPSLIQTTPRRPLVSPSSFPFVSSSSVASGSSRGLVCGELRGLEARA